MATKLEALAHISKRMQRPVANAAATSADMPAIADLIRRIDRALIERRAA